MFMMLNEKTKIIRIVWSHINAIIHSHRKKIGGLCINMVVVLILGI